MAEEIQISELELADELLQDMVLPVETATDTKAATLLQLKKWLGSSLPTGFILPAIGRIDDARFTLLDGKTLSRTGTYEEFCNKVIEQVQLGNWFACSQSEYDEDLNSKGQCGRFVIEDDYVRIPTITRYIGATVTLSEFGQAFNESLPNIEGVLLGIKTYEEGYGTGAFERKTTTSGGGYSQSYQGTNGNFELDASLSSSTYQDGAKVNVEHIKYPYYMVISTEGQTTPISVDINNVHEDINLKANKDLSDVTQVGKETVVGWGMPDYSAEVSQTWNTEYTATEDRNVMVTSGDYYGTETYFVINGIEYTIGYMSSNAGTCMNTTNFLIKKGTVYKAYGGYSKQSIKYQPLTGVN